MDDIVVHCVEVLAIVYRPERNAGRAARVNIRADGIENLSCGALDVFDAFTQELRIAVQADVVLLM
jgi:hypothetical protein